MLGTRASRIPWPRAFTASLIHRRHAIVVGFLVVLLAAGYSAARRTACTAAAADVANRLHVVLTAGIGGRLDPCG